MLINRISLILLTTVALASFSPAVHAQSENELRRQNEALRTQVADLERELDAARARIKQLEAQVEALRKALAERRGGTPAQERAEQPVSIDESKPDASPRALYKALVESYEEAMDGMERGASPEDRARVAYMRALERWASSAGREFNARIEWQVRILNVAGTPRGYQMEVVAVDPVHGTELGDPFVIEVSKVKARQVEQKGIDGKFAMKGGLRPMIRINPERETAGVFDNPKLIGPFAEYFFSVEVASLLPVEESDGALNPPGTP